jgi:hypothetical protein
VQSCVRCNADQVDCAWHLTASRLYAGWGLNNRLSAQQPHLGRCNSAAWGQLAQTPWGDPCRQPTATKLRWHSAHSTYQDLHGTVQVPQGMSVQHSCSAGGMLQAANRDTAARRVQTFGGMRLVKTGTTRAKHSVCNTRLQNASTGRREIRGTPGGGSNFTIYQKTYGTLIPQVAPPWSCSGLKPALSLCSAWCFVCQVCLPVSARQVHT